jgi:hypothetical protein
MADPAKDIFGYRSRAAACQRDFRAGGLSNSAIVHNLRRSMNLGLASRYGCFLLLWLAAGGALAQTAQPVARLQFDLFPGFNGLMGESAWFPAVFELKNDNASFNGTIALSPSGYGGGQDRRAPVELPSGSLKRVTIPAFCGSRNSANWEAQLFDERGRSRAEAFNPLANQNQGRVLNWKSRLLGALPRTISGTPTLAKPPPPPSSGRPVNFPPGLTPLVVRLAAPMLPDNPILLERLDVIYLNSERAVELKEPQVKALLAWLHAGGHLVVGVEQVSDVNTVSWLREIVPVTLTGNTTVTEHGGLLDWLRQPMHSPVDALFGVAAHDPMVAKDQMYRRRYGIDSTQPQPVAAAVLAYTPFPSLVEDAAFASAPLPIATGELRGGNVVASGGGQPLIVTSQADRGRVTALLFSPEREPARSWSHLPVLWTRLLEVPAVFYLNENLPNAYEPGSDGIFGALVDSRQVRKMPVKWLLILLVVYLAVIGPLDRWWLKKIGRPMLTWLTFPGYVVLFSLLIYFIGYKLRAGESEWTELHIVDVFTQGERAQLRGRTYASVYSPANQRYALTNSARVATLRGEFLGAGSQEKAGIVVTQSGDSFRAEVTVPVWTSQMCISDWWQGTPMPLTLTARIVGGETVFTVQNRLDRPVTNAWIAYGELRYEVGQLGAGERKDLRVGQLKSERLAPWVTAVSAAFQNVIRQRQSTFGEQMGGRLNDAPAVSGAASFLWQAGQHGNATRFVSPPGLDLSPLLARGQAVLLAWTPDYSPIQPLNQFTPRRSHRDTLWRVSASVTP